MLDQFLQWALEDTPGHVINYMGSNLPWQAAEAYRKASPLYQLDKVKTPMLIHVGENDERVPAAHARARRCDLRRYLKVPTQLAIYPGEPHGLMKLENRRAKMTWDHAWFDHYLLGKPIPGDEAEIGRSVCPVCERTTAPKLGRDFAMCMDAHHSG